MAIAMSPWRWVEGMDASNPLRTIAPTVDAGSAVHHQLNLAHVLAGPVLAAVDARTRLRQAQLYLEAAELVQAEEPAGARGTEVTSSDRQVAPGTAQ